MCSLQLVVELPKAEFEGCVDVKRGVPGEGEVEGDLDGVWEGVEGGGNAG